MEEVAHEICSTLCCSYCPFKNHAVSNCMDSLLKWLDTQQTKDIKQLCGMLRACLAKYVTKLHGVCVDCGSDGYISYKTDGTNTDIIDVGSVGKYICLCEKCANRRNADEK